MKKLFIFTLCILSSPVFAWNWDFLKPNMSTVSQSWNGLSQNQQNMFLAGSVCAAGIIYAGWPVSQKAAFAKTMKEFDARQKEVEKLSAQGKDLEEINAQFKPARFPYGSAFSFNRDEYRVFTDTTNITFKGFASFDSVQRTYVSAMNSAIKAKDQSKSQYWDQPKKTWVTLANNLD